jgi:hypothetical protein
MNQGRDKQGKWGNQSSWGSPGEQISNKISNEGVRILFEMYCQDWAEDVIFDRDPSRKVVYKNQATQQRFQDFCFGLSLSESLFNSKEFLDKVQA